MSGKMSFLRKNLKKKKEFCTNNKESNNEDTNMELLEQGKAVC